MTKFTNIFSAVLILLQIILWPGQAMATHMIGGEVRYTCLGGNQFEIEITLFQNCLTDEAQGAIGFDYPIQYSIYENSGGSPLVYYDSIQFGIDIETIPHGFSNECIENIPNSCLQRSIGRKTITLPPSEYGYTIAYQRCCRNEGILNIVSSGNYGVTYEAVIPPFADGECPNNSPEFINMPPQIICSNYPFLYSYEATDSDGDSLVYRLCESYLGASIDIPIPFGSEITHPPYLSVPYTAGLTYDNPVVAFPPAYLDPENGVLTFTPTASGRYQVKVCIDEYRDGELINTHSRDLQYIITNCSKLVVADIPNKSSEPNTYIVMCSGFTVAFENTSSGAMSYLWDFGDGSSLSDEFEPTHTYTDTGVYEVKLVINQGTTCADSTIRLVKIYPYFYGDFSFDGIPCPGSPISFKDSIKSTFDFPHTTTWDFGDGHSTTGSNPTHSYDTGGIYKVTMHSISELGCEVTVTNNVEIRDFRPNAGNDTIIVLGYDFHLNATGGDYYTWTPGDYLSDPHIFNPKVSFPDTGMYSYTVHIGADEGCDGSDTINILVVSDPSILMPNAFSPNGDGLNDDFRPKIVGYPYIEYFRVYDRWGAPVFVGYKNSDGWDGTYNNGQPANSGVYFYELSAKNIRGESEYRKGDVTLIR